MMDNSISGLYSEYFGISDESVSSDQFADITLDNKGFPFICWQSYDGNRDTIKASQILGDKRTEPVTVSLEGQALHSKIYSFKDKIWVVWAENKNKSWKLMLRQFSTDSVGEVIVIDSSSGTFFPCIASSSDYMSIAWCEMDKGKSRVMLAHFDGNKLSEKQQVSVSSASYRPGIFYGSSGELYIIYDKFENSNYDIAVRVLKDGKLSEEIIITTSDSWAASPTMCGLETGVLVAWYEIGANSQMKYNSAQLSFENEKIQVGEIKRIADYSDWSNFLSLAKNGNKTILAHSRGNRMLVIRDRKENGDFGTVVPLLINNERYHALAVRVVMDSSDNIHMVYHSSNANGHYDRNAQVIYGKIKYDNLSAFEDPKLDEYKSRFTQPIVTDKKLERLPVEQVKEWLCENGYKDLELRFGDIHGQSTMSDGTGEMDHYYNYARYGKPKMDFTALTDHDSFPDVITESEWEFMRTTSNEFNKDGEFVTLLAYEWTSNEFRYDFGHKNVYYRSGDGELFRSTAPDGMTPNKLFENIKKYDGICIPHHPAAIWGGPGSHSTDWSFHDPEVQRLAEIFQDMHRMKNTEMSAVLRKINPDRTVSMSVMLGQKAIEWAQLPEVIHIRWNME